MEEVILLSKLLEYFSSEGDCSICEVTCNTNNKIELMCCSCNNLVYSTSVIMEDTLVVENNKNSSIIKLSDIYKKYLKSSKKELLLVKEGYNPLSGKIAYINVKAIKYNLDSLLLELTSECDRYSNILKGTGTDSFICDNNEDYIDIYPLKIEENEVVNEEEISIGVHNGKVECNDFYSRYPKLKGNFNESLLKCIWSLIGNYSVLIKIVNYPIMYTLFLESIINRLEIC